MDVERRPPPPLDVDLATQDPVPEDAIDEAVKIMRSGAIFRYAEAGAGESAATMLEVEFARATGRRYAIGVNSCGSAMYLALHCMGVGVGDVVLMNSWTLAPVAGAVAHVGARAVLVETTDDLDHRPRRPGRGGGPASGQCAAAVAHARPHRRPPCADAYLR